MAKSHLLKYQNVPIVHCKRWQRLTSTFVLTAVTYKPFCLSTRQMHCFQAALVIPVTAYIARNPIDLVRPNRYVTQLKFFNILSCYLFIHRQQYASATHCNQLLFLLPLFGSSKYLFNVSEILLASTHCVQESSLRLAGSTICHLTLRPSAASNRLCKILSRICR